MNQQEAFESRHSARFTRLGWVATTIRLVATSFSQAKSCTCTLALTLMASVGWAQTDPARSLSELPGYDFSKLPGPAKKELLSVLTDELDGCGRPLTLYASLKKAPCAHTKRLVGYAAQLAAEGNPASEILLALSKYTQTFFTKRAVLKIDERQCLGPKDAKVTVVEFADFECSVCAAARPVVQDFEKKRPGVRVCYAPFPLSSHPNGMTAAQAALFARDAGKFWAMHDALFDHSATLSEPAILRLAGTIGLEAAALGKAMAKGKYVDEINASKEAGVAAGVNSTPTFFVNGRKLSLGWGLEALILAVDDEQDWVAGQNAWPKE